MTAGRRSRQRPTRRQSRPLPPRLEGLEARVVPADFFVTITNASSGGSLRQAVIYANAAAGTDNIFFSVGGTITLATQIDNPTGSVNLVGPGAGNLTVQWGGGFAFGLFDIASGVTVNV